MYRTVKHVRLFQKHVTLVRAENWQLKHKIPLYKSNATALTIHVCFQARVSVIYSQTESPYWGSIVMSGEPLEDFTSVALIWLDIMLTTSVFLKA